MDEKKTKYQVVHLQTYTSPAIFEDKTKPWVQYGEDNDYYQYLIDLYHGSATNNACIKGTADLIYGQGLEVVKADRRLKGYTELRKIFRDKDVRRVVFDLKMLGAGAFQLVKSRDGKKYVLGKHWPVQTLRAERCNEEGEITGYYYCADWSKLKRTDKPKRFAAFGHDDREKECILFIRPYSPGTYYYSPVDYQGGTQWAETETEISNYHLNNIKNGFAPSMLINFNNGEPPEEVKATIESQINNKYGGSSNSGRAIISWNDSKDTSSEITAVQLSDAHNQYQFLSEECQKKIMLSHRITSPMLLGIKDNTGLGNNAEEIEKASILFDNTVIRPFQNLIIDAIKEVLLKNDAMVDIYFKTLQPLEFTDLSGKTLDQATKEKEMGYSLSQQPIVIDNGEMTLEDEEYWLSELADKGEVIDLEEWELVEEVEVDPENEPTEVILTKRYAKPDAKSEDDKGWYKIRYRYGPDQLKTNSRAFCKTMISARNQGVVYRREDIDQMSSAGVNGEFAPSGKTKYSIWRFKGGVYCHHAWYRLTYRRKLSKGNIPLPLQPGEKGTSNRDLKNYDLVPNSEATRKGVPFNPEGWKDAKTRPIDMPNRGKLK